VIENVDLIVNVIAPVIVAALGNGNARRGPDRSVVYA
jgi:hypothetical protein